MPGYKGNMGKHYSYEELKQLWVNNGGDPSKANLMAAVAQGESEGWSGNWNSADPSGGSVGLWQINGAHGNLDQFTDPNKNAATAVKVYNSQGLGAWGAYTSGAYKQYLKNTATPKPSGKPPAGSTSKGPSTPSNQHPSSGGNTSSPQGKQKDTTPQKSGGRFAELLGNPLFLIAALLLLIGIVQ